MDINSSLKTNPGIVLPTIPGREIHNSTYAVQKYRKGRINYTAYVSDLVLAKLRFLQMHTIATVRVLLPIQKGKREEEIWHFRETSTMTGIITSLIIGGTLTSRIDNKTSTSVMRVHSLICHAQAWYQVSLPDSIALLQRLYISINNDSGGRMVFRFDPTGRSEKNNRRISIYFSPEQYAALTAQAPEYKLSAHIRDLIMSKQVTCRYHPDDIAAIDIPGREIAKLTKLPPDQKNLNSLLALTDLLNISVERILEGRFSSGGTE